MITTIKLIAMFFHDLDSFGRYFMECPSILTFS